jgi:VIT1/CCC1 family predicted Fe2+/Mn2+ transporter
MMDAVAPAMRVSNAIAIVLFLAGLAYGRATGMSPWRVGLSMVAMGALLVVITIALGG